MAELQPETRGLIGESEFLRGGPHGGDLVGGDAWLDEIDGVVQPFPALLVGVELGLVGAAHAERAVVARPVAHEGVDDVEESLVPGAQQTVGEHVGMRVATVARHGVDRLHLLGAELEQQTVGLGHDLALGDPGAQHLVDALVHGVDDGGGMIEQRHLLLGLDRARLEHDLRAVGGGDAGPVQGVESDDVGHVDPDLLAGETPLRQLVGDRARQRVRHARLVGHRPAHRRHARPEALLGVATARRAGGGGPPSRSPTGSDRRCAEAARSARSCRAPTPRCACSSRTGCCWDQTTAEHPTPTTGARSGREPGGPSAAWRSRSSAPSRPPSSSRGTRCLTCASFQPAAS